MLSNAVLLNKYKYTFPVEKYDNGWLESHEVSCSHPHSFEEKANVTKPRWANVESELKLRDLEDKFYPTDGEPEKLEELLAAAAAAAATAAKPGFTAGFIQDPYGLSRLRLAAQNAFCSRPAMSMLKVGKVDGDAVVVGADVADVECCRFSLSLSRSLLTASGLEAPNPPCWLSHARF